MVFITETQPVGNFLDWQAAFKQILGLVQGAMC